MIEASLTIAVTIVFIFLYLSKRLDVAQVILWSYAFQSWNLPLGTTLTGFFFLTSLIAFEEFLHLLKNRQKIKIKWFVLVLIPIFSYSIIYFLYLINCLPFEFGNGEESRLFLNVGIFLLKIYFPLLLLAHRLYRTKVSWSKVRETLYGIAVFSSYWAIFQFFIHAISLSDTLDLIVGLKSKYHIGHINTMNFIRVNAFFYEPKGLGIFLGISLSLVVSRNRYHAVVLMLAGLLTLSNLFQLSVLVNILIFLFNRKRSAIWSSFVKVIVTLFMFFYSFQLLIANLDVSQFKSSSAIYFALDRVKQRYNSSNPMAGNLLFGIPLQADLEGPVLEFIKDYPGFLLSGYGPYFGVFVPDSYWEGNPAYFGRLKGTHKGHLDMGVLYWLFEFGFFSTLLLFAFFLKKRQFIDHEHQRTYLTVILLLFFFRLEYILLILYHSNGSNNGNLDS